MDIKLAGKLRNNSTIQPKKQGDFQGLARPLKALGDSQIVKML